jgi:Amt family ammonium transporter
MSVPGLAILHAGLMKRKWAVNSSLMVLYGFGASLLVGSFWGYKMAFGTQLTDAPHFIGVPWSMLSAGGKQGRPP